MPAIDFPAFLHGGDYNPDQWLDRPDILEKDVALMQKARVNCVSIGIFSWSLLEPEEGVYRFEWLDSVIDRLHAAGISVCLATPSGARPAWMAERYPEVLRTDEHFIRHRFGARHNHCLTSPVYREKVKRIDAKLSERYGKHPAVKLWHIGNEFGGYCYCDLCKAAFQSWLKEKYRTLDELNRRWWGAFWSHRYSRWEQIDPPSPLGETSNPSMKLDYARFMTAQCASFIREERQAIRKFSDLPVTINMMWDFVDYDYAALAKEVDVISWDAYPYFTGGSNLKTLAEACMNHDYMRSLKDAPFLMIESSPSKVNWHPVNHLKRPGMHLTSSLLAIFSGSDSVMYFQWRKGRGGSEAFHGAVLDHSGRDETRVFRDVQAVGDALLKLSDLKAQPLEKAKVLLISDAENRWACLNVETGAKGKMDPILDLHRHHRALMELGIRCDVKDMRADTRLEDYSLVVCPQLFMYREGFEKRLERYVRNGGHVFQTCFSGIVDADGLAFLGGAPHGTTDVFGVRDPELDALYPEENVTLRLATGEAFPALEICEYPEAVNADTVLGVYEADFIKGLPCFTMNHYGAGLAFYLSARVDTEALKTVYSQILKHVPVERAVAFPLPKDVVALRRGGAVLIANLGAETRQVCAGAPLTDRLNGGTLDDCFALAPGHCAVVSRKHDEGK